MLTRQWQLGELTAVEQARRSSRASDAILSSWTDPSTVPARRRRPRSICRSRHASNAKLPRRTFVRPSRRLDVAALPDRSSRRRSLSHALPRRVSGRRERRRRFRRCRSVARGRRRAHARRTRLTRRAAQRESGRRRRQQVSRSRTPTVHTWRRRLRPPGALLARSHGARRDRAHLGSTTPRVSLLAHDAFGRGPDSARRSERHGGHLDWYSFDAGAQTLNNEANPTTRAYIPAPIAFAGMPAARWWQLEDGRVDFGAVDAQPTDLATLLLIEFALTYGNDWGIVTLPVPAGTLCRITSLSITDVLASKHRCPHKARGSTW